MCQFPTISSFFFSLFLFFTRIFWSLGRDPMRLKCVSSARNALLIGGKKCWNYCACVAAFKWLYNGLHKAWETQDQTRPGGVCGSWRLRVPRVPWPRPAGCPEWNPRASPDGLKARSNGQNRACTSILHSRDWSSISPNFSFFFFFYLNLNQDKIKT